jgi:hypothetical protein
MREGDLTPGEQAELELEALRNLMIAEPNLTLEQATQIMDLSSRHGVDMGLELLYSQEPLLRMQPPARLLEDLAREMEGYEAEGLSLSPFGPSVAPTLRYLGVGGAMERWEERQAGDRAAAMFCALTLLASGLLLWVAGREIWPLVTAVTLNR